MRSTSNIAAYFAWILALVAILMPPALATAGADILIDARDALYGLLDEEPAELMLADVDLDEPGWKA